MYKYFLIFICVLTSSCVQVKRGFPIGFGAGQYGFREDSPIVLKSEENTESLTDSSVSRHETQAVFPNVKPTKREVLAYYSTVGKAIKSELRVLKSRKINHHSKSEKINIRASSGRSVGFWIFMGVCTLVAGFFMFLILRALIEVIIQAINDNPGFWFISLLFLAAAVYVFLAWLAAYRWADSW